MTEPITLEGAVTVTPWITLTGEQGWLAEGPGGAFVATSSARIDEAAGWASGAMTLAQKREMVGRAAREGRATYVPAGAGDNATARVYVDGQDVGQASALITDGMAIAPGRMYEEVPITMS